jgi:hypothetical protein
LPSRAPLEGREILERCDSLASLRNTLQELATKNGEWAGIPMPLEGESLIVDSSYPFAAALKPEEKEEPEAEAQVEKLRNIWWSERLRGTVVIWEEAEKILHGVLLAKERQFSLELRTLGCSDVWGIEQEHNALKLLGSLVSHRQFKQYLLTGMFLETSQRSGLTYVFRKLRPTLAVDARDKTSDTTRILCALCMHPIAYYEGSWAGAMCPTDDVIAHLSLMRGDEHMFWKRCNQHPANRPEAGL